MLRGSPAAAYSSNVVASVEGTAGDIRYAEARTYLQLLDRGEKTMNSPESEYHFELKDAYFVRVRVDAAKLAPILFRMSCQNWGVARGTPGSRDLLVGAGPDHMAREVEAALAWLQHQGEQGQRLAKLASLRYLPERELSVAEQMRLLGLEPSADRTYRNWAQRLHDRMIAELSRRSERRGT